MTFNEYINKRRKELGMTVDELVVASQSSLLILSQR